MLSAAVALALAGEAPALDLELSCPGQYRVIETSTGTAGKIGDVTDKRKVEVTTAVLRPGTAQISLRGDSGEIVYPDGERRALAKIEADERRITAEYVTTLLFIKTKWRMEVSRLTGDVRVTSGSSVGFLGTCAAAPTKPKF